MKSKVKIIREEIKNIGHFMGVTPTLSSFFIDKKLNIKKRFTDLIKIKDCQYKDYLIVNIDIGLYKRLLKLYKLTDSDQYFKTIEFIIFFI